MKFNYSTVSKEGGGGGVGEESWPRTPDFQTGLSLTIIPNTHTQTCITAHTLLGILYTIKVLTSINGMPLSSHDYHDKH